MHPAATSPLSCRWIESGSETRISNWSLAVCLRTRVHPRIVTEEECAACSMWECSAEANPARSLTRPKRA